MWDLVSHGGLWERFIENGNCTSTPFLPLQAFDFLKNSHRSALTRALLILASGQSGSQSLAEILGPCECA